MRRLRQRLTFGAIQTCIALFLLGCFSIAGAQAVDHFAKAKKKPKVRPYAITSSVAKTKTAFNIKLAGPGDSGTATMTLQNVGTKPARIRGARTKLKRSALDQHLAVSIYDATTKQCVYPKPKPAKVKKPKKGKKALRPKPSGPCTTTGPWSKVPASIALTPIVKGKYLPKGKPVTQWKRKERHKLANEAMRAYVLKRPHTATVYGLVASMQSGRFTVEDLLEFLAQGPTDE